MANHKQIKELIDLLADKTLGFGCEVAYKSELADHLGIDPKHVVFQYTRFKNTGSENIKIIEKIYTNGHRSLNNRNNIKILGHPISLGTVLDSGEMQVTWTVEQRKEKRDKLLDLWDECGFTTSFQDIINKSGWEKIGECKCKIKSFAGNAYLCDCKTQLKSPSARNLAEFLISIFLTKQS